jgi:hypothetical protein
MSPLLGLGCSPPKPTDGVVRPSPGEPLLETIQAPMPGFGSFDSPSDALLAACQVILSKPNATAGRVGSQDFQLRWRISREYCAWLYYTPEHKYEMTMLTDQSRADDLNNRRSCVLPRLIDDKRYPPDSLKYIFALHNHPFEATLSDDDIRTIVSRGLEHGFEVDTKGGKIRLSIIAFFSRSNDFTRPTCDGFFQYIPITNQLLKWTRASDSWICEQIGTVKWSNETMFHVKYETVPCPHSR